MTSSMCAEHPQGTFVRCRACRKAWTALDRHPVSGVGSPAAVAPSDARNAGPGIDDLNEKPIAWSAVVKPGVRVHLELAVSSEGELYVESVRFADVGDPAEPGPIGSIGRDLPVGYAPTIRAALAKDSHSFAQTDRDGRRGDGDDHASPDVHAGDATALNALVRRAWFGSELVRVTIAAERAS